MLGRTACLLIVAVITLPREVDAQSQGGGVAQLGWMAGCWQQRIPERNLLVEEQWMTPRRAW